MTKFCKYVCGECDVCVAVQNEVAELDEAYGRNDTPPCGSDNEDSLDYFNRYVAGDR